ncbi:MAG: hypothetical protein B0D92_03545 [Spirochaeta sp. LUC14_002_19_P3]|nr:MAG: hypothetical protein B0D92_03545 [Spirochaeta sp. LUC14_002_19_P3]
MISKLKKGLRFRIIFIISVFALALIFVALAMSQQGKRFETEIYVNSIFNVKDRSKYACDIPLIKNIGGKCGFIEVPADYNYLMGERYSIFWQFFPALTKSAKTQTLVLLMGGPGESTAVLTWMANIPGSFIQKYRKDHNILFYDYRGVGLSDPYDSRINDMVSEDDPDLVEKIQACNQQIQQYGIYYDNISTANNVRDLEQILNYLKLDKVIPVGFSYGTKVALTALRDIPDRILAAVLDGVFPIEVNGFAQANEGLIFNLSYFFDSLNNVKASFPAEYGNVEQRIMAVLRGVGPHNRENISRLIVAMAKYARSKYRFIIAHRLLALYEAKNYGKLMELVDALETREDKPLDAILEKTFTIPVEEKYAALLGMRNNAMYMALSIVLPEELNAPYTSNIDAISNVDASILKLLDDYTGGAPLPRDMALQLKNVLKFRPVDAVEYMPVKSSIPTLIISGSADTITPPQWGQITANNLSNSRHVIFNDEGHVVSLSNSNASDLIKSFVDDTSSLQELDTVDNASAAESLSFDSRQFEQWLKF